MKPVILLFFFFYLAKRSRQKGLTPVEWAKHFIDLKKDQDGLVIFKIDDVIGMYGSSIVVSKVISTVSFKNLRCIK